jgi:hypothetical protein
MMVQVQCLWTVVFYQSYMGHSVYEDDCIYVLSGRINDLCLYSLCSVIKQWQEEDEEESKIILAGAGKE